MRDKKPNKILEKKKFRSAINRTISNTSMSDYVTRSASSVNDDGFGSSENSMNVPIKDALLKIKLKSLAVDQSNDAKKELEKNTFCAKNYPSSKQMQYKYSKQHDDKPSKQKDTRICINLSNTRYRVLRKVAKEMGFKIVRDTDLWNICWTDAHIGVEMCKDMKRFQKVNHFPGMFEICRKDLLARNLNRMVKLFPLDYQIFPKTWCFPADLGEAIAYSKQHRNKTYIIKPDQGAQGRGIWLTKNLKEIKPTERMICQLYINKPLLIDGFKFDLRVYTLITSTNPLRIFVYKEGLARFATSKYREPCDENTSNLYMHLTNYSVNKHSNTYSVKKDGGSKRKFSAINQILSNEGYNVDELWSNIDDIIVKTVLSAYSVLKHNYSACFPSHDLIQACFEILGIDIIIDNKLKPYILEVNHSPSFHTDEQVDMEVKEGLIKNVFSMLNVSLNDKKKVLDEDKKRVKSRLLQKNHWKDCKRIRKDILSEIEKTNSIINSLTTETLQEKISKNSWASQIAWEESNMNNFRRILPCPDDPDKYNEYFLLQNQASVYCDTAASKRREECAKQQRKEFAEKVHFNQQMMSNNRIQLQTLAKPVDEHFFRKKTLKKKEEEVDMYQPEFILESDERERMAYMLERTFLMKSCGLLQNIMASFYRYNLLTPSDHRKYKDVFAKIKAECAQQTKAHLCTNNAYREKKFKLKDLFSNVSMGMTCSEAQINSLPSIPYTKSQNRSDYRTNKANVVRHVTNVFRRKNLEIREQWTDNCLERIAKC